MRRRRGDGRRVIPSARLDGVARIPIFSRIRARCVFTGLMLIESSSAICSVDLPAPMRDRICDSRDQGLQDARAGASFALPRLHDLLGLRRRAFEARRVPVAVGRERGRGSRARSRATLPAARREVRRGAHQPNHRARHPLVNTLFVFDEPGRAGANSWLTNGGNDGAAIAQRLHGAQPAYFETNAVERVAGRVD